MLKYAWMIQQLWKLCSETPNVLRLFPSRPRKRWHGRLPRWLSTTSSTSQTITARSSPPRYKPHSAVSSLCSDMWNDYCSFLGVFLCLFTVMTPLRSRHAPQTLTKPTVHGVHLTKNRITLRKKKAFYVLPVHRVNACVSECVAGSLGEWWFAHGLRESTSSLLSFNSITL